ncbi:hypothetical protein [Pseudoxanthomonas indica]|uniref:Uncharacterized protein n=1 Tax=Pseudoxanthomonas indica TaxID=428993 RepID=A0A1T5KAM6_9GAMM|nr:hypothetical protein [Pseudoxanthomonas indica]GGD47928.1 hypothetical protein GCM10007235_19730 [Pseudoxanthomonas indica]SKC60549.1 hypothetical protein SAMN06296058_1513 [Pseudoxanthomonas indica]
MDIIKRLVIWFLSGAALVAGGYAAAMALGLGEDKRGFVEFPTDLEIDQLKASPVSEHLTVVGRITSTSARHYRSVFVDLDVRDKDTLLVRCQQVHSGSVLPKGSRSFQVTCPDVLTSKVPAGVTFAATVSSASYD